MTTEEIITIYETMKSEWMKAHHEYQCLCNGKQKEIDHPDSIAFRQAKDKLDKIGEAFDAFSEHEWN